MRPTAHPVIVLLAGLAVALAVVPVRAQQRTPCDAMGALSKSLKNPRQVLVVLAALRSTQDKATAPLFEAGLHNAHEPVRVFCVQAIADLRGAKAAPILTKALRSEESSNVQAALLSKLLEFDAATPEMLNELLTSRSEKLRCLTACAMVGLNHGKTVRSILEDLTESTNPATEIMARISLLKLGDREQPDRIARMVRNRRVPEVVLALMCKQVSDQNVQEAEGILRKLATSSRSMGLRMRAMEALVDVSDSADSVIVEQIVDAGNPVFAAKMLKLLSDQKGSAASLRTLVRSDSVVAPLARFELARQADSKALTGVAKRTISKDSLLNAAYIISRAKEDANSQSRAPQYVPALSHWLESLNGRSKSFKAEHRHAVKATAVLVDVGRPEGLGTIRTLLNSRYSARTLAVAMGLLTSENSRAIALAGPLLESPYPKLVRIGAMTLGRFGRKTGRAELVRIATAPQREGLDTTCLANWYILKIDGEAKVAAKTLASVLR